MKKTFLLFAALFCLLTVNAAAPEKLYLTPNSSWLEQVDGANPRFAACFMPADKQSQTWQDMPAVADATNVFEVTVPTDKTYKYVIFCRMNGTKPENKWENKYNQTSDLEIPMDGTNHYTVKSGTWDNGGGDWTTYGVVTSVTGVTLNAETLTLVPGAYSMLTATVLPAGASNKKVTWDSSAEDVVAVTEDGYIVALKAGQSTITVTTEEGAKTAQCAITVSETAEKGLTIRFTTPEDWGEAYLYVWDAANTYPIGPWPGAKVITKDDEGYFVTFDAKYTSLNFIVNNNDKKQTADVKGVTADACYTVQADGDKWKAISCDGTDNPGDGGETTSNYGIQIDTRVVKATLTEDGNQYLAKAYVNEGEVCKLINTDNGDTWMCALDAYSVGTFTLSEDKGSVVCSQSGCYHFYIKLQYGNDQLYIGEGKDCPDETPAALENVTTERVACKVIENGQIYIIRDGVRYNVLGAQVK